MSTIIYIFLHIFYKKVHIQMIVFIHHLVCTSKLIFYIIKSILYGHTICHIIIIIIHVEEQQLRTRPPIEAIMTSITSATIPGASSLSPMRNKSGNPIIYKILIATAQDVIFFKAFAANSDEALF